MRSYYDVLGCAESSSGTELKAAYHSLLRRIHPDKQHDEAAEGSGDVGRFVLVQNAYRTLGNEKSRQTYDFWLREQRLREDQHRVDRHVQLEGNEERVDEDCRCGSVFEIDAAELERIVDYALFECETCSLQLKVSRAERPKSPEAAASSPAASDSQSEGEADEEDEEEEEVESSVLGTKEYWDQRYASELEVFNDCGEEGTVWFGRVAEERILGFVDAHVPKDARICDLGCANGAILKRLRSKGYTRLCGVDYSENAIQLARSCTADEGGVHIEYQVADLAADSTPAELRGRFDCLLDKGTWDAMSLAPEGDRMLAAYRRTVAELFDEPADGTARFFVVISCNFTVEELKSKFLVDARLLFHAELPAKQTFTFGGRTGSTTSGVVFRFQPPVSSDS